MTDLTHAKETSAGNSPKSVGPYSQSVTAGGFIFCSGQVPVDPQTSAVVAGGIKEQATQALANLKAVLADAGADLASVARTEVFLKNMDDFAAFNDEYAAWFIEDPKPARTTVEVARLPKDVLAEIACVAYKTNKKKSLQESPKNHE